MSGISRLSSRRSSRGGEFLPTRRTLFPLHERERAVTERESALGSSECLKSGAEVRSFNLDYQQRASVRVQFVLVMYTPSFRPFVSEIDIRWSAGRPAASRLYDALLAESRHAGQRYIASDGIVDAVRDWRRAAPDS